MDNALLLDALRIIDDAAGLPPLLRAARYREQCSGRGNLLAAVLELEDAPGDDRAPVMNTERLNQVAPALFSDDEELPDTLLNSRAGPYLILEKIGQGGMGRVYRALHTGHNELVALKVLAHVHGEGARQRLRREAELLARCRHPSIVRILYSDLLPNGDPYFTMDLVDGSNITEFCRTSGLGLLERLQLFQNVCYAVRAAHSAGVIHRDLKPNNTRVDLNGAVKLLDFGTSEVFDEVDRNTRSYISVAYAAPEHTSETSVRTDVYSLGVLLAELVLGRLPFDPGDGDPVKLRKRILAAGMPPLRSWMSETASTAPWMRGVSRLRWVELEAICARAAAQQPGARYASVEELQRDVERLLERRPVRARQPRALYRARLFLARHIVSVALCAVFALLFLGLASSYVWGLRQQRNAAVQQRSMMQREANHSRALVGLLQSLFLDGDGVVPPNTPAMALLDRGMRSAQLMADPEDRVEVFETLGQSYEGLGEYAAANQALNLSIAACRRLHQEDTPQMAELLAQLATLRVSESNAAAALPLAEQAYTIDVRLLPAGDEARLQTQVELAQVDRYLGRQSDAQRLLEDAIRWETGRPALLADLSQADNELSLIAEDQDDMARFYTLQLASLAIDRSMEGNDHPDVGEHLLSLADTADQVGQATQGVRYAKAALANLTRTLPPEHPDVLSAQVILGTALAEEGRTGAANTLLTAVLSAAHAPHARVSTRALAEWGLGLNADHAGQLSQAASAYLAGLALYRQLSPQPSWRWVSCLRGLARVEMEQGELPQAEADARQAVALAAAHDMTSAPRLVSTELVLGEVLKARHGDEEARQVLARVVALRNTPGLAGAWLAPMVAQAQHEMPPLLETAAR